MKIAMGKTTLAATSVAVALLMLSAGGVANAAPTPALQDRDVVTGEVVSGDLDRLSEEEVALFRSGETKYVTVDPNSGDVTSVTPMTPGELAEATAANAAKGQGGVGMMAVSNFCPNTSLGCWSGYSPSIPLQFTLGVTTGSWSGRVSFYTGDYYAKLCWLDPSLSIPGGPSRTYCMPERNGTKAVIDLGQQVTGTRVDLSRTR